MNHAPSSNVTSPKNPLEMEISSLQSLVRGLNRWYLRAAGIALVIGAVAFWLQYLASKKSEELSEKQSALIAQKDTDLAVDLKDKDVKIAQAEARAMEARLELEKFKAPRVLAPEQQSRISASLARFDKAQRIDVSVDPVTVETMTLAEQILSSLKVVLPRASWSSAGGTAPFLTGASAVSGVVAFSGQDKRGIEVAVALAKALNDEGVRASSAIGPLIDCPKLQKTNPSIKLDDPSCFMVIVVVGPKP